MPGWVLHWMGSPAVEGKALADWVVVLVVLVAVGVVVDPEYVRV